MGAVYLKIDESIVAVGSWDIQLRVPEECIDGIPFQIKHQKHQISRS